MATIKELESEIHGLQCHEESFGKQRARIDWLKEGDRNTKFFHSRAKARFSANRIDKLKNDHSRPTFEQISEMTDKVGGCISSEEASLLDNPYTEEEVLAALKSIGPYKAPRVDGFHAIFYQTHWELIKPDLLPVKRDKLTLSKHLGGLGFRDFSKFNQALLGKQLRRVLSNPDSLVTRVLKSKIAARLERTATKDSVLIGISIPMGSRDSNKGSSCARLTPLRWSERLLNGDRGGLRDGGSLSGRRNGIRWSNLTRACDRAATGLAGVLSEQQLLNSTLSTIGFVAGGHCEGDGRLQ
ncbi:Ribonuclease H-like superfamily protein [Striga hermonthica]|uniref:Ribonuclease H-like superfamily protein n=1 Tax=Striga hermonthica TaxID=68872 RepID=A0A9N7MTM2_STRHE|nr:Ribonuclease H-like superfamily protein [Striga hermonthica]